MKKTRNNIIKLATSVIFFSLIVAGMFLLWQRQPKQVAQESEVKESSRSALSQKQEAFEVSPTNGTILNTNDVTFTGKFQDGTWALIYSNDFQILTNVAEDGSFKAKAKLANTLNLVNVTILDNSFEEVAKKNLALYVSKNENSDVVIAGPVKTIFDTLLTITSAAGDINVRTSKESTSFDIPQNDDDSKIPVENIRIGDYIIALAKSLDEDSVMANSIEVIRENKPVISTQAEAATILAAVRENIFSAKNGKGEVLELTLNKNSNIILEGEAAEDTDIKKGQKAIIFFTSQAKEKVVSTIYLLP